MFNLFKAKIGGIIGNLGLADFYATLTLLEQEELKDTLGHPYQLTSGKPYRREDLIKGDRNYGGDVYRFLRSMAGKGGTSTLSLKLYKEALMYAKDGSERFFANRELAEYYYRKGDHVECERFCLFCLEDAVEAELRRSFEGVSASVYKRLAIMYEKQGRIQEAVNISEKALLIGLQDGTKGGYEGRLNRLKKKCSI